MGQELKLPLWMAETVLNGKDLSPQYRLTPWTKTTRRHSPKGNNAYMYIYMYNGALSLQDESFVNIYIFYIFNLFFHYSLTNVI